MAVISAQLSEPPPSLSARVPGLPAAADRVIAKALAKSPADRYDRCLDFAEALLAACRLEAGGAVAGVAGVPYSPTRAAVPVTPPAAGGRRLTHPQARATRPPAPDSRVGARVSRRHRRPAPAAAAHPHRLSPAARRA